MVVDGAIELLTKARIYNPSLYYLDKARLLVYLESNVNLSVNDFICQAVTWKIVPVYGFGVKRLTISAANWLYSNKLMSKSRFLKAYRSNPMLLDSVPTIRAELLSLLEDEVSDEKVVGYLVMDKTTGDYVRDAQGRYCLYPKSVIDLSVAIPVVRAEL